MKNSNLILIKFGLFFLVYASQTEGDLSCNRNYDGTTESGVIESPNYPFDYQNEQNCIQSIFISRGFTPGSKKVCFTFDRFRLDDPGKDYLLIGDSFYGNGSGHRGESIWEDNCVTFQSNEVRMQFISDKQYISTGYRAKFQVIPVEDHITPGPPPCTNDKWRCLDGKCIDQSKVCDSSTDCSSYEDGSYAHARCSIRDFVVPGMAACDYSKASEAHCRDRTTYKSGWIKETSSTNDRYGPPRDHTGGDTPGHYLRTIFRWNGPKSFIYSVQAGMLLYEHYCLSFWYHMRGKDPGSLRVFWSKRGSRELLWSRTGNHGNKWHRGQLENTHYPYDEDPEFEVARGGEIESQIALDDISILQGPCHTGEDISCNFEDSFCGWTPQGEWSKRNTQISGREEPPYDSSSRNVFGICIVLESTPGSIRSPTVTSTFDAGCLSFYIYATGELQMTVRQVRITDETYMISTGSVFKTDEWEQRNFNIPGINLPYQIKIEVDNMLQGTQPKLFIDEITLIFSPCQELDLKTCSPNEFRCDDKSLDSCIPSYLKCDGRQDCADGSDERNCQDPGRCQDGEFMCSNKICVPNSYRCNGFDDCGDGSDEDDCNTGKPGSYMGSFTIAAVASIIAACVLLVVIIFAKAFMCYYKRRPRTPQNVSGGLFNRRGSNDSMAMQPPPTYDQCADNLSTYPQPRHKSKVAELGLPSYDLVQKEQYVQITIPIEDEVRRMKEAMATRNNSIANSDLKVFENFTPVTPASPPITGAAAIISDGSLVSLAPVMTVEAVVHRPPGLSYHKAGQINRAYSGSDMSTVSDNEDEKFSTA